MCAASAVTGVPVAELSVHYVGYVDSGHANAVL